MRVDGMRGYRARFILNFRLVFVLSKTQVFSGLLNEPLEETVLTASGPGLEVVNTDALVRLVLVSQARGQGHGGETVSLPSWFAVLLGLACPVVGFCGPRAPRLFGLFGLRVFGALATTKNNKT